MPTLPETPDGNVPVLWSACLAAELQRTNRESIIPLLIDTFARCKRAAEGETEGAGESRH
jgi:hypothetical protein